MAKQIHEHSKVIANTLEEKISETGHLLTTVLVTTAEALLPLVKAIHIVA